MMHSLLQTGIDRLVTLGVPLIVVQFAIAVAAFAVIAGFMVVTTMWCVFLERRVLALLTVRMGPNRVGPNGSLQIIADTIKLLIKEDIIATAANPVIFTIAPVVAFVPVMLIYMLLPYSAQLIGVNLASGLLLILAISSITTVGILFGGWASNNKYSLLGGIRSTAQAISYEIPMVISALSIAVLGGSMKITDIVQNQSGGIAALPVLNWNIFSWFALPGFVGFIVFFICVLAELNRTPFDLPEAESELVSGYNTEYTGIKFAYFFLAEYAGLFIMSLLLVTLFLGGYLSPFHGYVAPALLGKLGIAPVWCSAARWAEQLFWMFAKTYTVVVMIIWVRATLPRLRVDQLMAFSWKFLLPLSLVNLLIVSIIRVMTH